MGLAASVEDVQHVLNRRGRIAKRGRILGDAILRDASRTTLCNNSAASVSSQTRALTCVQTGPASLELLLIRIAADDLGHGMGPAVAVQAGLDHGFHGILELLPLV